MRDAAVVASAMWFLYVAAMWLTCALISMMIAGSKNRSAGGWFLVGLVFGPIGFAVGLMQPLPDHFGKGQCGICFTWNDNRARKCVGCHSAISRPTEPASNVSVTGQPLFPHK